jgi:hypothetical protein
MSNSYTSIIMGNGLGMAVDPSYFTLEAGLQKAWSQLNLDIQTRIKNLITNGDDLLTEQQLEKHYEVIRACVMLQRFESNSTKWLDRDAKDFPLHFQKFIENTAWHFCNYDGNEGNLMNLIKCLKYFIQHNYTHLITLNYDKLIYSNFATDDEIMNDYSGQLVDGFLKGGFRSQQLNREFGRRFGWYLHLHGSPLFYTCSETNLVKKTLLTDTLDQRNKQGLREHIILCNINLKSNRIAQSELLFTYWHYFLAALDESEKVIFLGYSGNDSHINHEIENWMRNTKSIKNKTIQVIEYADSKFSDADRQTFWSSQLGVSNSYFNNQNLIRLPSILSYQFS